ncbi:sulfur carrier protein ThiS [Moraxella oblonga]|uniref:sulfur carrier protein ThiS n=1 Tax=Moraxella oblonga TaxID=200413 RepID=UPI00083087B3|nr:sulfur carrier protein ThiS [Moraxella oblonga]
MKQVSVNGMPYTTDKTDVKALLDELKLTEGRFAVEIDGVLVPKSRLDDVVITDGMKIEVVQAVGGG